MKKLPFYISVGVATAAVAALVITWLNRNKYTITTKSQNRGSDFMLNANSGVNKTFAKFDYNLLLNKDTIDGKAEISLLQAFINAYYGSSTPSVAVTGTYDTATRNAVYDITGKAETSIYEFFYLYFAPVRSMEEGYAIIDQMTTPPTA